MADKKVPDDYSLEELVELPFEKLVVVLLLGITQQLTKLLTLLEEERRRRGRSD